MQSPILVIEDSDSDYETLAQSLKSAGVGNALRRCATGFEVKNFLSAIQTGVKDCPALILLDLHIPGGDGCEILQNIKKHPILKPIPVIVLTTSALPADIETCYRLGASGYLVKQVNLELFESMILTLTNYWLHCVQLPRV